MVVNFHFIGKMPRSVCQKYMLSYLRNYQAIFQSGCTIYIPISNIRDPVSSHPYQHFLLSPFKKILVHLIGV